MSRDYIPERVVIARYRAQDGTLHDSPEEAISHDAHIRKEQLKGDVADIIRQNYNNIPYDLQRYMGFTSSQGQEDGRLYQGRREAIAELILDNFEEIEKAVRGEET